MSHNTFRRLSIVLALSAFLGTPLASLAAPHRALAARAEIRLNELSPLTWLWSLLERAWEKAGCRIDPSGQCMKELTVVPKAGCRIDPNGQCLPEPMTTKNGCLIDPNGRCLPESMTLTDAGCSIDPYGRCLGGH
jgi:hypothetical protein